VNDVAVPLLTVRGVPLMAGLVRTEYDVIGDPPVDGAVHDTSMVPSPFCTAATPVGIPGTFRASVPLLGFDAVPPAALKVVTMNE
jgi:hypothetical protein